MALHAAMIRTLGRLLAAAAFLLAFFVSTRNAHAYAWMIRHGGSSQCSTCHVDPSGGYLLNDYGRSEISGSLSTQWGKPNPESKKDQFLFGVVTLPEWFQAGGSVRTLALWSKVNGADPTTDFILMQADLRAAITYKSFRAYASAGFISNGYSPAAVISSEDSSIVSREHWVGWTFADDKVLLRAGRIALPFGVRNIEHTQFVRSSTRTDLNDTQQHGVSVNYNDGPIRAEIMGIAGNYQLKPADARERGYSAYFEYTIADHYALGASSLFTHAKQDLYLRVPVNRQAHGVFARIAPIELLAILAEVDYVSFSSSDLPSSLNGVASMLQLDLEPIQGVHIIGTGETQGGKIGQGPGMSGTSWGAWGGVQWFVFSHFDVRVDYMHRNQIFGNVKIPMDALMAQGHIYL